MGNRSEREAVFVRWNRSGNPVVRLILSSGEPSPSERSLAASELLGSAAVAKPKPKPPEKAPEKPQEKPKKKRARKAAKPKAKPQEPAETPTKTLSEVDPWPHLSEEEWEAKFAELPWTPGRTSPRRSGRPSSPSFPTRIRPR
jgi:hypothetical protein